MNIIKRNNKEWLDPYEAFTDMQRDLDRLFFGTMSLKNRNLTGAFIPELELTEDANQYLIKAELPGMKKEDVDISIHGSRLVIKGEKKEERETKEKSFFHSERRYGSFERTVEFAEDVDPSKVKANYRDGVLEIVVPKSETAKPKQIKVAIS